MGRIAPWQRSLPIGLAASLLASACAAAPEALALAAAPRSPLAARDVVHTITGDVRTIPHFHSRFLPDDRDLVVYLPPGYDSDTATRYPVLYMQDGQNLFDAATAFLGNEWHLDETAQSLIQQGAIGGVIIVGIDNTPKRLFEYTWVADPGDGGGGGQQYAEMVATEIKPLIDRTFRTLPDRRHTAVMGSSLGGLISFSLGRHYPQIFGNVGMMSPSIWWDNREILSEVPDLAPDLRIWLDMGTQEGDGPQDYQDNLAGARALDQALLQHGYRYGFDFGDLGYYEDAGAAHNETYWSQRAWRPLEFFFGTGATESLPR